MQVRKGKPVVWSRLSRTGVELSREARVRLAWMDFYRGCGNVARTCRHFGISRQTSYRWRGRYDPYDLTISAGTIPLWKSAARRPIQVSLICTSRNYSVASAYELISHASEISSKSGRTHSMGMPPFFIH